MAGELTHEEREARDQQHLLNPEAGDYWNEMFTPICVVLGRGADTVTVCKKTKAVDDRHWTWDLAFVETMTLEAFAKWLRYKGEAVQGKTWCTVFPGAHLWAREAAMKAVFGEPSITPQAKEAAVP